MTFPLFYVYLEHKFYKFSFQQCLPGVSMNTVLCLNIFLKPEDFWKQM